MGTYRNFLYYFCFCSFSIRLNVAQHFDNWAILNPLTVEAAKNGGGGVLWETPFQKPWTCGSSHSLQVASLNPKTFAE
jgi:hypothetical protein